MRTGECRVCRRKIVWCRDWQGTWVWQHVDGGPDGTGSDHRAVLFDPLGCGHPGEVGL